MTNGIIKFLMNTINFRAYRHKSQKRRYLPSRKESAFALLYYVIYVRMPRLEQPSIKYYNTLRKKVKVK